MDPPDVDMTSHCDVSFITILDLSPDAHTLYASDSIIDVLGYTPEEVVNQSCWDFFPPEEVSIAKKFHQRGIDLDRAASLAYCRIRDKSGNWVGCECCATVVFDVLVVCTSIYKSTIPSQKRAADAPLIRRIFASAPKDPRYHMLSHISAKLDGTFKTPHQEPRAALFLNRFTRSLTIMYATSGLEDVLGVSAADLRGRSFYYCIAENCLQDAIKCLETAKANDSIAYLRFWFRDPLTDDSRSPSNERASDNDTDMTADGLSWEPGTAHDNSLLNSDNSSLSPTVRSGSESSGRDVHQPDGLISSRQSLSTSSQNDSTSSSASPTPSRRGSDPIELEAVISCASDGLVVCLRQARPMPLGVTLEPDQRQQGYRNGLFAAPWAEEPVLICPDTRLRQPPTAVFAPSLDSQDAQSLSAPASPYSHEFMAAIQEQAIFAWALTGINGSIHRSSHGKPHGESLPPQGLSIWQIDGNLSANPVNDRTDSVSSEMDEGSDERQQDYPGPATNVFGDPGLDKAHKSPTKSR